MKIDQLKDSTAIREAIGTVKNDRAALDKALADAEARRLTALLGGDFDAVNAAEAEMTDSAQKRERCELLLPALKEKLAAAETAERRTEAERLLAAAEKERDRVANLIETKYADLAAAVREICEREIVASALAEAANAAAAKAGLSRRVERPLLNELHKRVRLPRPTAAFGIGDIWPVNSSDEKAALDDRIAERRKRLAA